MSRYVPESCSVEPFVGNGGGRPATSKCSCGQPLVTGIPGVSTCLGDFIGAELRRVERELRQMDGYVPWWQTQEFKDSLNT